MGDQKRLQVDVKAQPWRPNPIAFAVLDKVAFLLHHSMRVLMFDKRTSVDRS